jgi:FdhD protein
VIFVALAALEHRQPLNEATRAARPAAACWTTGDIAVVRGDLGRHNALDKLIGAMLRAGVSWDGDFELRVVVRIDALLATDRR